MTKRSRQDDLMDEMYKIIKKARYNEEDEPARRQIMQVRPTFQPKRQFVPRTMGPFAVSESKYFDSYLNGGLIAEGTSWADTELDPTTLNTLCCPQEGADIDNRIGRKISVYKISLRGVITTTGTQEAPDILSAPGYRLILYLDQQTNGTQSQGETVMASPGAATIPLTYSTFQSLANLGRFRVLRDIIVHPRLITSGTDNANTTSQSMADIPFKLSYKFKNPIIMQFNATSAGTIGDIVDNSFHLLGQKTNANFTSTISYQCRTYYKDR